MKEIINSPKFLYSLAVLFLFIFSIAVADIFYSTTREQQDFSVSVPQYVFEDDDYISLSFEDKLKVLSVKSDIDKGMSFNSIALKLKYIGPYN